MHHLIFIGRRPVRFYIYRYNCLRGSSEIIRKWTVQLSRIFFQFFGSVMVRARVDAIVVSCGCESSGVVEWTSPSTLKSGLTKTNCGVLVLMVLWAPNRKSERCQENTTEVFYAWRQMVGRDAGRILRVVNQVLRKNLLRTSFVHSENRIANVEEYYTYI